MKLTSNIAVNMDYYMSTHQHYAKMAESGKERYKLQNLEVQNMKKKKTGKHRIVGFYCAKSADLGEVWEKSDSTYFGQISEFSQISQR